MKANPFTHMAGTLGSMNPFAKMATSLATRALPDWVQTEQNGKPLSRTETIRRHLKESGCAMTSEEIAFDLDDALPNFGSHLVWLLLKHDVKKGRIVFDGRYSWNQDYDTAEATAIRAAVKLLKAHGYGVTAP